MRVVTCHECDGKMSWTCIVCGGTREYYVRMSDGTDIPDDCENCDSFGEVQCEVCDGGGFLLEDSHGNYWLDLVEAKDHGVDEDILEDVG